MAPILEKDLFEWTCAQKNIMSQVNVPMVIHYRDILLNITNKSFLEIPRNG